MNSPLQLFPQRIAIGKVSVGGRDQHVYMTPEFYRALREVLSRIGGSSSDTPDINQVFFEAVTASVPTQNDVDWTSGEVVQPNYAGIESDGGVGEAVYQRSGQESPMPFRSLSVTASPMTIAADRRCAVRVAGGAVSAMVYSRAGSSVNVTGALLVEMSMGDTLTITYSSAPTLTLIPR